MSYEHVVTVRCLPATFRGHFVAGTPVRSVGGPVGVNRPIATLHYRKLREIMAEQMIHDAPVFGEQRKGRRGRGLPEKSPSLVC